MLQRQAFVRDSELKGFAVRITTFGAKSFILKKPIDGKLKRLTLGRYPELTVEQARKEAHKLLGHIVEQSNVLVRIRPDKQCKIRIAVKCREEILRR